MAQPGGGHQQGGRHEAQPGRHPQGRPGGQGGRHEAHPGRHQGRPQTGKPTARPAGADVVAVETVEYTVGTDTYKVVTFSDNSFVVIVNGSYVAKGADAVSTLSSAGISVSVASGGRIVSNRLASNVKIAVQPRPVTVAESNAAQTAISTGEYSAATSSEGEAPAVSASANNVTLPTNVVIGSGGDSLQQEINTQETNNNNNVNGTPISR